MQAKKLEQSIVQVEAMAGLGHFQAVITSPAPGFYFLKNVEGLPKLLLADIMEFFPKYSISPIKEQVEAWLKGGEYRILTTVTIPGEDITSATTNLVGPLILDTQSNRIRQFIIHEGEYCLQQQLFPTGGGIDASTQP